VEVEPDVSVAVSGAGSTIIGTEHKMETLEDGDKELGDAEVPEVVEAEVVVGSEEAEDVNNKLK